MLLVATVCVLLGVWQLSRLSDKHQTNIDLRRNARAAAVRVTSLLHPAGTATAPSRVDVQFRKVSASGTYDGNHQSLLRKQIIDGNTGYLVVTPLRTDGAMLLVVRGFVTGPSSSVTAPPPPAGRVTVIARVWPADTSDDHAAQLSHGQVESINAVAQAKRLGAPVFDGYAELLGGQSGGAGLVTVPRPDLSNPAGGAPELQHLAYVIQWFLFAALAIAAPVVMARAEAGHTSRELDDEPDPSDRGVPSSGSPDEARAAKLADRYGRPRV
jgi:cytochrome oxidase assembly protein ShyY1